MIGLDYVGLPLAVEFGKKRAVIGFDVCRKRVEELERGNDATLEVNADDLRAARHLCETNDAEVLRECGIVIVTVPTPIDRANLRT